MLTFGEQLLNERRRLNMSRRQLAGALGISYDAVRAWELGQRTPSISELILNQIRLFQPLRYGIGRFQEPDNGNQN